MAERILNTRIITKHAELAAWEASTLPLKEGEIVLAKINIAQPDGTEAPTFVAKVGNGSTYAESPYLFAKAADVYAWAKKENLALTDIPEITLDSAAAAKIKAAIDANKTSIDNEVVRAKAAEEALGARIDVIEGNEGAIAIALAAAKEYADELNSAMDTRVAAIEDDYLKAADKTALQGAIEAEKTRAEGVEADLAEDISAETTRATAAEAKALQDAKDYADGLNTTMDGRVDTLEGTVGNAESGLVKAVADNTANIETNASDIAAEATARAQGDADTLAAAKSDAAAKDTALHTTISAEIDADVEAARSALQTNIDKKVDKTTYDAKINDLESADTNLDTRLDSVEAKLNNVTNVMDFRGAVDALPATEGYQNGDVIVVTNGDDKGKEFVLSDGTWVEFGSTTAADTAIANLQTAVDDLQEKVDITGKVSTAISAAVATEATNREAADADILAKIGTVGDNTTVVAMIAAAEAAAKAYADANDADTIYDDTAVRNLITTNANAIAANKTSIESEVTRAKGAEGDLQTAITAEETRAKAAEKANADALAVLNGDAETAGSVAKAIADSAATLQTAINAKANQTALDAEEAARESADTALGNRITAIENLKIADTYATKAEHNTLAGRVTTAEGEIDTLQSKMSTAETDIENIETDIQTNVVKVSGSNLVVGANANVIIFDCGGAE